jgi:molybdopterin molybdotransferase
MTTVDEHAALIERLLAQLADIPDQEMVPLADALGRVTAHDVLSPVDLPLFRNSQMDGFAVFAADLTGVPVTLPVVGDQPAGASEPARLQRGCAIRIMTGAVMPTDADCVVPVEDTRFERGPDGEVAGGTVTIARARSVGEFVRERGSDLSRGSLLLAAGIRMSSRHLAALAAAGVTELTVRRRIRVAVITTGAELTAASTDGLRSGQIFDANRVALTTAIREAGAEVSHAAASDDIPGHFLDLLDRALDGERPADLVITSGGISQGAFEVVREALEPLGASVITIAMQPGGPQATAVYREVPVIGFPGNPVSTQVSFVVFLRPILRRLAGLPVGRAAEHPLATGLVSVPGKRQFLRGRYLAHDGDPREPALVEVASGPSSHLVAGMAHADVLLDIPAEIVELDAGDPVRVWEL